MHAPALGSAAATLAVSLIYLVSPPAPDAQRSAVRAGIEAVPGIGAALAASAPADSDPDSTADPLADGPDGAAGCEVPRGRATEHWIEYLEFRRAARSGRIIRMATPPPG
jgi:hypothetical protein